MNLELDALKTALRVLKAINTRQAPEAEDVDFLQECHGSKPDGMMLDDYTCEVIQTALAHRA